MASFGAPDAGVERPVVTNCASGDPMFCPVKRANNSMCLRGL